MPSTLPTQTRHALHGQYPQASSVDDLLHNRAQIQLRIEAACQRVGRDLSEVRLLPVSKTQSLEMIRLAYAAGWRLLGENKVQEAQRKWEATQDLHDLQWSVIGHLQTNKARHVAQFASEFQALDSLRLARALDQRLQNFNRQLDVYVQINTSGEDSKYGLSPEEAVSFVKELSAFETLRVRGLMTLAMLSTQAKEVRQCFVRLRQLRDQLQQTVQSPEDFTELSMGMSGDFEIAIEEGATVVRVGQAIFGARSTPDSAYWPS
ncbi:YggS family pyridoxal phosphate-dependent enzyme [Orrella sp. 11846]|uniref:YggS family pyridoxal phosphate-dependent enzyme n=1 Tax=Orrella sp. 11846 TaxID=3409913 RepID=UPI003B5A74D4